MVTCPIVPYLVKVECLCDPINCSLRGSGGTIINYEFMIYYKGIHLHVLFIHSYKLFKSFLCNIHTVMNASIATQGSLSCPQDAGMLTGEARAQTATLPIRR